MSIPNHSFHLSLTPSGVADSRYPDGNDGSAAIPLVWAMIPSTLQNQEGMPVNLNLRTYLTEPGSPAATLSILGSLPAGWSFAGSTLSFSGTGTGSAPVQVRAVRGAVTVDSNFFTVESIPSAAVDSIPPTQVTGLVLSLISGGVAGSFDAASDIKVPGITSSLMKDYQVYRDGVALGSPIASSPGISVALTFGAIGSPNPSLSAASQSSADYAFNIGGDAQNLFGSIDSLAYARAQMTGDFTIIGEVDFPTSTYQWSKVGLMMRAGLGTSDPFVHVVKFPDSSGNGVAFETRATLGGTPTQSLHVAGVNGRTLLKLTRAGSVFTGYYWTGSIWSQLGSVDIGMTDPIYAGISGNSGADAVTIGATVRQVNIQNLPAVAFTDTTASASTHTYAVVSRDLASNVAAAGAGASITVGTVFTFPMFGSYNTGGTQNYDTDANIERCSLDVISIFARYPKWESGRSRTMKQTDDAIHAKSTIGTKVVQYVLPLDQADPQSSGGAYYPLWQSINTANWWLRTAYPSGAKVAGDPGFYAVNLVAGGPTLNGRTYQQHFAAWAMDWAVNGDAAGLSYAGADQPNPSLDGFFMDNLKRSRFTSGDWLRTGAASGTDSDVRAGEMAILNILKAAKPGSIIGGNVSEFQVAGSISTEFDGQLDFAVLEGMIGETWSYETFKKAGDTPSLEAELIRIYAKQMAILKAGGIGLFVHMGLTSDGRDNGGTNPGSTVTPYQGLRHGLACCLVLGNAAYCPAGTSHYSVATNIALWFDEFAVNRATGIPYATPTSASAPGLGYLGRWTDPPQTAPTQGTAYRRRAEFGEAWWNSKIGVARVIDFGRIVRFIQGRQAPAVNKGGTGTSAPIGVRDGLIVLY